jgi:hypothetical protein
MIAVLAASMLIAASLPARRAADEFSSLRR